MNDPVPTQARTELERLAGRWHQLPIGQARSASDDLRRLAETYLDVAGQPGRLPDLGPATALDQLTVAVYEATRAEAVEPARLAEDLVALRHAVG